MKTQKPTPLSGTLPCGVGMGRPEGAGCLWNVLSLCGPKDKVRAVAFAHGGGAAGGRDAGLHLAAWLTLGLQRRTVAWWALRQGRQLASVRGDRQRWVLLVCTQGRGPRPQAHHSLSSGSLGGARGSVGLPPREVLSPPRLCCGAAALSERRWAFLCKWWACS